MNHKFRFIRVLVACLTSLSLCVFYANAMPAVDQIRPPSKTTAAFSASNFAGSTSGFVFPTVISAIVSSDAPFFPPESVVGFIGATPSMLFLSYLRYLLDMYK